MTAYPRAVSRFALAALPERNAATADPELKPASGAWPQRPSRRTVVRLWLPLTALLLVLAPVPLLLAPLAWLAPARFRPANPYLAVLAVGRILLALSGTVVDVDTPDARVSIRIY